MAQPASNWDYHLFRYDFLRHFQALGAVHGDMLTYRCAIVAVCLAIGVLASPDKVTWPRYLLFGPNTPWNNAVLAL